MHQSQFRVTLRKCPQVQKVMPVGCDWWISIRLVCFDSHERWMWKRITLKAVILKVRYVLIKVMTAINNI